MQLSRRAFFGAARQGRGSAMRPPWAMAEEDFQSLCTRCGECIEICPTDLLLKGSGGFPEADFTPGRAPEGCTYCEACLQVCAPQALKKIPGQAAWLQVALIGDACLAAQGVVCRSCGEGCEVSAIRFPPRLGGVALPQLDPAVCNGCAACLAVCPTHAIQIHVLHQQGAL